MSTKKPKISLVLSGGGIKGAFQVGFLSVLAKSDFEIDVISTTSTGFISGMAFASGRIEKAIDLYKGLKNETDLLAPPIKFFSYISHLLAFWTGYAASNRKLKKLISAITRPENIEKNCKSLHIHFVDEVSGNLKVETTRGRDKSYLIESGLAATAIPFIYKPIMRGNMVLSDGGLRENVPIETALRNSQKDSIILVLHTGTTISMPKQEFSPRLDKRAMRVLNIAFNEIEKNDIKRSNNHPIFHYYPSRERFRYSFDVNPESVGQAIKDGQNQANKFLKDIENAKNSN